MLKVSNIAVSLDEKDYAKVIANTLNIRKSQVKNVKIAKKAVDARRKNKVHFNMGFTFEYVDEDQLLKTHSKQVSKVKEYHYDKLTPNNQTIMVVGSGPAGLFCAYNLARSGQKVILIEQGKCVDERKKDIDTYLETGKLNTQSNVQFGEGGAGTFSDGKLTTGIKDYRKQFVLNTFYEHGASEDILYLNKPHLGTDVLINVVKNIRKDIEKCGDVRFENVNFSYNPDKQILFDVSLFAKPGQKIAFVGATGAGKTTITNLINRFYDIQSGSITYDGIDVKLIKKADLRKSLGIVLQDTNLFTGTIMDNIRYGRLDANDEECIAASKLANAHEFIKHLEHGYDTMIHAGGESLSQGQRQLLSIARAAVANPPVLILDEATSSIDTHTERIVQEGMDKLMEGRTVFVIAHRLSTIQNSDAIMVLEQGHIIERGNHEDLLKQKGKYYQLYTGAFELD